MFLLGWTNSWGCLGVGWEAVSECRGVGEETVRLLLLDSFIRVRVLGYGQLHLGARVWVGYWGVVWLLAGVTRGINVHVG